MFVDINYVDKKYNVIYADPPWNYPRKQYQDGNRNMTSINDKYPTMTINELKELPIKRISNKDSICLMWTTDSHLKYAIELLETWGFKYKTIAFVWVKQYESGAKCVNVAPWTLKSWEICILGTKGDIGKYKKSNKVRGLLEEVRTKHSKKPLETVNRINELFGDIPKIELFARDYKDGWDCWGNEVN